MVIQSLAEYAAYAPRPLVASPELTLALELIREYRALDLRCEAIQSSRLSLELLLQAMLIIARENGFIKYDPWDHEIQVKQFGSNLPVFLYNPHRDPGSRHASGQAAAPRPGGKPDFLDWETFPENEHYLIWTASSGRHYGILVQPAPIVPDHLIIASLDLDPETGRHAPQVMTGQYLADMQELQPALFSLGYAMGYNDRRAGASVDHFHTQAIPGAYLPLINAYTDGQLALCSRLEDGKGVTLSCLGPRPESGAEGAYPIFGLLLEAGEYHGFLHKKQVLLEALQQQGQIFNSIGWLRPGGRTVECFFPRRSESVLQNALKAGYVEVGGMFVIPGRALFDSLQSHQPGWEGLGEAGMMSESFLDFYAHFREWFLKS